MDWLGGKKNVPANDPGGSRHGDDGAVDRTGENLVADDTESVDALDVSCGLSDDGAPDGPVEVIGPDSVDAGIAEGKVVSEEQAPGGAARGDTAASGGPAAGRAAEGAGDDDAANAETCATGKSRHLAGFHVDSEIVKKAWRAHSLGRVALLCTGLFVIAVASFYFFLMQPAGRKLHEVSEAKSLLHDYIVIQQAGATIGSFKDGLMVGDQRLTVMSEVSLMAEGSGVRILGDPELLLRRKLTDHFSGYPVRLRVRGTYHEIGEFLSLLESSPRFIVVESVEMTSDAASASRESDATLLLALAAWEG